MRSLYKRNKKVAVAGIRCNCCRPTGTHSTKEARVYMNRYIRRTVKLLDRAELKEIEI